VSIKGIRLKREEEIKITKKRKGVEDPEVQEFD
jgi:hypothetical protein